jgi:succinylarginine dihydrolase
MSVADKILAELDDLHADETSPGMAAVALALAKAIDETDAPTAKAVLADKLRPIISDLRKLAPVGEKGDTVDDIAEQRAKRRAAARKQAAGQ